MELILVCWFSFKETVCLSYPF